MNNSGLFKIQDFFEKVGVVLPNQTFVLVNSTITDYTGLADYLGVYADGYVIISNSVNEETTTTIVPHEYGHSLEKLFDLPSWDEYTKLRGIGEYSNSPSFEEMKVKKITSLEERDEYERHHIPYSERTSEIFAEDFRCLVEEEILNVECGESFTNAPKMNKNEKQQFLNLLLKRINHQNVEKENFVSEKVVEVDDKGFFPLRKTFEEFGYQVFWNKNKNEITLKKGNETILLTNESYTFNKTTHQFKNHNKRQNGVTLTSIEFLETLPFIVKKKSENLYLVQFKEK